MFPAPTVRRQATPHYDAGRDGQPIVGICFHIAQGSRSSVLSWFSNPASKVSSHYLISRDGSIDQFVDEADTAWAQGQVNRPIWPLLAQYPHPNRVLISVEHEGYTEQPWTEAEYQADLTLCLHLCETYGIQPERPYLLSHRELDTVDRPYCPGPNFPWDRLLADLQLLLRPGLPAWLPPEMLAAMQAGISDGSRPLEPVTRAGALAMVMRAASPLPPAPLPNPMPPDVPPWLLPHIGQALAHRITDGSSLNDQATRLHVMVWCVRALAATRATPAGLAPGPHWWATTPYQALAQGLGISDGTRPGEVCTRGEAMAMAVRLRERVNTP